MCLLHRAISCLSYLRRYLRLLCVEPLGSSANSCHQYDVGRRERYELREAIEEPLVLLFALAILLHFAARGLYFRKVPRQYIPLRLHWHL